MLRGYFFKFQTVFRSSFFQAKQLSSLSGNVFAIGITNIHHERTQLMLNKRIGIRKTAITLQIDLTITNRNLKKYRKIEFLDFFSLTNGTIKERQK